MDAPELQARYAMLKHVPCGIDLPKGWTDLVDRLCKQLAESGFDGQVGQIKEKFGALRFYADGATEEQYALIRQAEQESLSICEECGIKSSSVKTKSWGGRGWVRTLCTPHGEKR